MAGAYVLSLNLWAGKDDICVTRGPKHVYDSQDFADISISLNASF